jgi:hypothetical protein
MNRFYAMLSFLLFVVAQGCQKSPPDQSARPGVQAPSSFTLAAPTKPTPDPSSSVLGANNEALEPPMLIVGEEKFQRPVNLSLLEWMVQNKVTEKAANAWVTKNFDQWAGPTLAVLCESIQVGQPQRTVAICLDAKDPFSLTSTDLVVIDVKDGKPVLLNRIPIDVSISDDDTVRYLALGVTVRDGRLTVHDRAVEHGAFPGCARALVSERVDLLAKSAAHNAAKRRLIEQACAKVGQWELRGPNFVRVAAP